MGVHNLWFRRAVCEQHKYGSVRGALRDEGSYSIMSGGTHASGSATAGRTLDQRHYRPAMNTKPT